MAGQSRLTSHICSILQRPLARFDPTTPEQTEPTQTSQMKRIGAEHALRISVPEPRKKSGTSKWASVFLKKTKLSPSPFEYHNPRLVPFDAAHKRSQIGQDIAIPRLVTKCPRNEAQTECVWVYLISDDVRIVTMYFLGMRS